MSLKTPLTKKKEIKNNKTIKEIYNSPISLIKKEPFDKRSKTTYRSSRNDEPGSRSSS
jgi:hypothetical protein